jgi:hypothetical protein
MHSQRNNAWTPGVLSMTLLVGLAGPVYAVDGVIEINQAKAKVGGVTPGDTPLFPVTISQSGSYRLTSNLDVTDASARPNGSAAENTTAIEVSADNVTIDLNGFMIKGPTVCSGSPLACSPTGSGIGVHVSPAVLGCVVMNGTVQGMGSYGLQLVGFGSGSHATAVRARSNAGVGISAETVSDSSAIANGDVGIDGHVVTNCSATSNGSTGIHGGTAMNSTADLNNGGGMDLFSVAAGCAAGFNTGVGLSAITVANCYAFGNGGDGILATTVSNSTAINNCTSAASCSSGAHGIVATTVTGCTASANGGTGQIGAAGITGQNICGAPNVACP